MERRKLLKSGIIMLLLLFLAFKATSDLQQQTEEQLQEELKAKDQQLEEELKAKDQQLEEELKAKDQQLEEQLKAKDQQLEEELKAKDQQLEEKLKVKDLQLEEKLKAKDQQLDKKQVRLEEMEKLKKEIVDELLTVYDDSSEVLSFREKKKAIKKPSVKTFSVENRVDKGWKFRFRVVGFKTRIKVTDLETEKKLPIQKEEVNSIVTEVSFTGQLTPGKKYLIQVKNEKGNVRYFSLVVVKLQPEDLAEMEIRRMVDEYEQKLRDQRNQPKK